MSSRMLVKNRAAWGLSLPLGCAPPLVHILSMTPKTWPTKTAASVETITSLEAAEETATARACQSLCVGLRGSARSRKFCSRIGSIVAKTLGAFRRIHLASIAGSSVGLMKVRSSARFTVQSRGVVQSKRVAKISLAWFRPSLASSGGRSANWCIRGLTQASQ